MHKPESPWAWNEPKEPAAWQHWRWQCPASDLDSDMVSLSFVFCQFFPAQRKLGYLGKKISQPPVFLGALPNSPWPPLWATSWQRLPCCKTNGGRPGLGKPLGVEVCHRPSVGGLPGLGEPSWLALGRSRLGQPQVFIHYHLRLLIVSCGGLPSCCP